MSVDLDLSGANGSGSSAKVYSTPDYERDRSGAYVMLGYRLDDCLREVRVVDIEMTYLAVRVRIDGRDPIQRRKQLVEALVSAAGKIAYQTREEMEPAHVAAATQAFIALRNSVMAEAGPHLTEHHLAEVARKAREDGLRNGAEHVRANLRMMLGVQR
jgi:hypothetical protein